MLPGDEEPGMGLPLIQVDAFTDTPFAGNPAAVCLLDGARDDAWLQAVGAEMNLPEPAFLTAPADGFGLLVEVESAARVRALTPDLARLATVPTRGVIVTAPSDDARFDFVSRFFAPRAGIPEDPATGSAHCCLGPYWAERLGRTAL